MNKKIQKKIQKEFKKTKKWHVAVIVNGR